MADRQGFEPPVMQAAKHSTKVLTLEEVGEIVRSTTGSECEPASKGKRSRLQDLASLRMNLLVFDLAGVPATTEGLYQIDSADHLLAVQLRLQPLAG
jgi:hypothetical protein